jgi:hypothetical protein
MNQVGNDENSVTSERPHPVVYTNPLQDDEIDLVDLWIVIWSYRKLFLSSVILFAVIGILYFELAYNVKKPTSTVRSVIEIESIIDEGERIPILELDVLIKRIQYSKLPRFSSLSEFEQIKPLIMATRVSPVKRVAPIRQESYSYIVEIVTKVPTGEIADSSRFHGQLVDEIMPELNKSAELTKIGIHDNIFAARSRIVNLKGSIIGLEQDLLEEANSQVASNQLLKDEIGLRKANVQSEIDILTERVKYLELTLSNTGSLVLLKAGVSWNSSRPIKKSKAYSIILISSLFLAPLLTMGAIFARKVKERMAGGD